MLTDQTHLQLHRLREHELERRLEERRRAEPLPRPSWRTRAALTLNRLADRLDDQVGATRPRLTSR